MKTSIKETKGITLIVLVITIIILLILAGISILALGGENGLFARARQAKNNTLDAQNAENEFLNGYEYIISEQVGEKNNIQIENKKSEGQIFIETAGIEYNYTSLDDFVTNSSDEQKQILTSNDAAMDYLRTHSSLISELKSTSNYEELVPYLLNIDSSINMSNYNVGLPCYISKGNTVYLGTSWELESLNEHGNLDTSDSSKISLYLTASEPWYVF